MKMALRLTAFVFACAMLLTITAPAQATAQCGMIERECIIKIMSEKALYVQNTEFIKWEWMRELADLQAAGATEEEIAQAADARKRQIELLADVACYKIQRKVYRCICDLNNNNCGHGRIQNVLNAYWGYNGQIKVRKEFCCQVILDSIAP